MTDQTPQEGELILYRTADDAVRVEVLNESETFWLDQRRIAELFGVEVPPVSYHLRKSSASGEPARAPTLRRIPRIRRGGNCEARRELIVNHFVLDDERLKLNKCCAGKRDASKSSVDTVRNAV